MAGKLTILDLLSEAVKYAENNPKNHGILTYKPTNPDAELRKNVKKNLDRWMNGEKPAPWINERPPKFVDFMRRRWAPLQSEGATNDPNNLNKNWAPNVRGYIRKRVTPEYYKYLESINLVKNGENNESGTSTVYS